MDKCLKTTFVILDFDKGFEMVNSYQLISMSRHIYLHTSEQRYTFKKKQLKLTSLFLVFYFIFQFTLIKP